MYRYISRLFFVFCLLATGFAVSPVLAAGGDSAGSAGADQPGQAEFRQGWELIQQKQFAAAIVPLKKAIAAQPGNADYLTELAYASRKAGDRDASFAYYEAALKADPDHIGAMNYLGMLYIETDRPHKAAELLEKIDEECFFTCDEYTTLKAALESGDASAY